MKLYLFLLITVLTPFYIQSQNSLSDNSDVVAKSLNGLRLINEQWHSNKLFSLENEKESFFFAKQVSNKVFAISKTRIDNQISYYLNVFTLDSKKKVRAPLYNVKHGIFNDTNFKLKDNQINIFVSNNSIVEFQYDLQTEELVNVLAKNISGNVTTGGFYVPWYESPSGKLRIEFKGVNLILHRMKYIDDDWEPYYQTISSETLIAQTYDDSWSFGLGVWNGDEKEFYFDNTGAVACIWKLDLSKNSLSKIVPEHEAFNPIILRIGNEKVLGYFLENHIMIAKPKE